MRDIEIPMVSESTANRLSRHRIRAGDILFARRGVQATGLSALAEPEHEGWLCGTGAILLRSLHESLDAGYLSFVLASEEAFQWLRQHAVGAVMPNLNESIIRGLPLRVPPPPEQKAIAHILGTLDDKIELNRRMNETLEGIARAVFKSWFVDFDPVRAKLDGRHPPGMDAETASLFPDGFEDSELGKVPRGWKVQRMESIADLSWGDTSVTKKSYAATGFPAFSAKGRDGLLPYYDFDRVGVVVSAIGANAGTTWLARGKWSCIKNTIRFWATDRSISTEYLYYATNGEDIWPLRGSAQPFISQMDARNMRILCPGAKLGSLFGDRVRPIFEAIEQNKDESQILSTLRDTLLPKLLSGEIRVGEAAEMVGEG